MSDEALKSPPVEHHRTPDLMDQDPLLQNLKDLHEETKSDDDDADASDNSKPSTSQPKKCSPSDGVVVHQRKNSNPGNFMWIWLLGIRVPALIINGEPNLPIEIFDEVLAEHNVADACFFQDLLRNKNVYVRMGTQKQFNMVSEKSEVCRKLKITTMSMMTRSDIERIMGELRRESRPTRSENDIWDHEERMHVVHVNFIDYSSIWLEGNNEVIEEDNTEQGTHGYWYRSRRNMRCIVCRECNAKFTPTDFILHHHFALRLNGLGITHHGCTSGRWQRLIELHSESQSPENLDVWDKYTKNGHRFGKRAYGNAAPRERELVIEVAMDVEGDVEVVKDDGESAVPLKKQNVDWSDSEDEEMEGEDAEMYTRRLHVADFLGPSCSHSLKPRDKLEELIFNTLSDMDEKSLETLLNKSPEDFYTWLREMEFAQKVIEQQNEWEHKRRELGFRHTATANFNNIIGDFENMREFETASAATKQEIFVFAQDLMRVERERSTCSAWETIQKEHKLIKNLSWDALRVLDNKPLPPPPKPLSVEQMAEIATQILLNNPFPAFAPLTTLKPVVNVPLAPLATMNPVVTPLNPITPDISKPITPITPLSPSAELLKQQISMAITNQQIFSMLYPKMPTSSFEQLTQLLKTTTVQN